MECQLLFSGKIKKNITKLSSAKLAQRLIFDQHKPPALEKLRETI